MKFSLFFEMQLADEMQHVRYGNEWVKKLVERGGPRVTFEVAKAVAQAGEALRIIADANSIVAYPVAENARREAGFSDGEIAGARKLAEQLADRSS